MITRLFQFVLLLWFSNSYPQSLSKTMVFDGEARSYRIYIPAIYDGSQSVPLVMALHGLGDNAANFEGVGFNEIADTANFIAVYPNALPDPILMSSGWNTGIHPFNTTDDVGFLNALIDTVSSQYAIDTNRIYCTGFSLGGFMTYRLACEIGARLAAVASVAGSLPAPSMADCYSGKAMPVLHIHGTSDPVIPYNFGMIYVVVTNLGADSTTHYWAMHNGCDFPAAHDSVPDTENDGLTFEKYSYSVCSDSTEVILFKANGMDHNWPFVGNDINATDEIWDFFSRHYKASTPDTINTRLPEIAHDYIISPNPASGLVSISPDFSGKIQIILSDMTGKEIFRDNFNSTPFTLPLHHLREGIYLLTLADAKSTATRKLIICDNITR